jgi:hypothetical protein
MVRRQPTAAELWARAETNDYPRGVHMERDPEPDERLNNDEAKQNHDGTLNQYVLWRLAYAERDCHEHGVSIPSQQSVRDQYLGPGTPLLDLAKVKDFLRFYIQSSEPRLADRPTTDSMGLISECLFAGFTCVTGTIVPEAFRSEAYREGFHGLLRVCSPSNSGAVAA